MPNAHDDKRSDWAEALSDFGPETKIYNGPESRKALSDLLSNSPATDEHDVTRRLRGRPSLNPNAQPGRHSRQLNVRIGEELGDMVALHLTNQTARSESELVRTALSEFFERHQLPSA
ncbi:MAG: hypothetical protein ABI435_08390 [Pseudolysinimonas sp.]